MLTASDLASLLLPHLGTAAVRDLTFTSKPLTAPGENYGSMMLAVEVTLSDGRRLPLVAKLPPPTEFLYRLFDYPVTALKEADLYKLVRPLLPANLDVLPKYYGSRDGEVLLLEDLRPRGYSLRSRTDGLSEQDARTALKALGGLHAACVAVKIKQPDVFKSTVMRACADFNMSGNDNEEDFISSAAGRALRMPELQPYKSRIHDACAKFVSTSSETPPSIEPFSTLVHNDCWVNNIMFGPKGEVKFVDFQTTRYSSPVKDVVFFLFTSVAESIDFDHLIKHYHDSFLQMLRQLNCPTDKFAFNKFQQEMEMFAPSEFAHALFMLRVACAEKSETKDLSLVDDDHFKDDTNNPGSRQYTEKVKRLVLYFAKKNWI